MMIFFHPAAEEELLEARRWYLEQNPAMAQAFLDELDRAVGLITEGPERWRAVRGNVRRILLRRFPYAIYYEPGLSGVVIIAVSHCSRRPEHWRDRV